MIPRLLKHLACCGNMPRDLFSTDTKDHDSLVASPESQTPRPEGAEASTATGDDGYHEFTIHRDESRESNIPHLGSSMIKQKESNNLHPYVQTLSLSNLESCVALENAVFPEEERCTREKVDALSFISMPQTQSCFPS